jgi:uncharacterized protein YeaO (DUF488 family)
MAIRLKRAYDPPAEEDGYRVLVDRIWPRGVTKERLRIHAWLKDIAPSAELRTWFGHDPARWAAFRQRYADELSQQADAVGHILRKVKEGPVTLVYGAKDPEHNNAVALMLYLTRRSDR